MPTLVEWGMMVVVVALAATLDLWRLGASGYGNLYYAAAVRSMSENWHNLFFVSYDPGGFVSVDKPPLGFWAQVLSVKLLGFSGFALLLPEALAGVASVTVLWRIVRRAFGAPAGIVAALALAISPVSVVTNRDNVLEPLLTLTLLLAAWAATVATERGALRWLLVCAALVGLGFNIKMLEAYLVVPALALIYLLGAPMRLRMRLLHLALAGVVMLTLSFAWVVAVDMTPASQRPYVGSTTTNSELELALGYNGIGRLFGGSALSQAHASSADLHRFQRSDALDAPGPRVSTTSRATGRRPHTAEHSASPSATGAPDPLRLFQAPLGSQDSWLLPLAIAGFTLIAGLSLSPPAQAATETADGTDATPQHRSMWRRWTRWRLTARLHGLALWGMWLLTVGICFSFARSINVYYVAVLAPAICALAGAGAVELWRAYRWPFLAHPANIRRGEGWLGQLLSLLLPLSLLVTLTEQATLLGAAPRWQPGLAGHLLTMAVVLALALVALRVGRALWPSHARAPQRRRRIMGALAATLASLALAVVFIAPTGWTLSSLTWGNAGGWPAAGPEFASAAPVKRPLVDAATVRYLLAHRGDDRYLVGALNSYLTAPLILATGQPVLDMGGFDGSDPILTAGLLARLVAQDQVHLFLLPSSNVTSTQRATLFTGARARGFAGGASAARLSGAGATYTNSLTRWISTHCAPVPPSQWSSAGYARYRLGAWEMFSCEP